MSNSERPRSPRVSSPQTKRTVLLYTRMRYSCLFTILPYILWCFSPVTVPSLHCRTGVAYTITDATGGGMVGQVEESIEWVQRGRNEWDSWSGSTGSKKFPWGGRTPSLRLSQSWIYYFRGSCSRFSRVFFSNSLPQHMHCIASFSFLFSFSLVSLLECCHNTRVKSRSSFFTNKISGEN